MIVDAPRRDESDHVARLLLKGLGETAFAGNSEDGDELDASYPESGSRLCTPGEDDEEDDFTEDGSDDEPSLGSGATHAESTQGSGLWANPGRGVVDAEDEHDGAEEDHEGDDSPDHEPNLGWTVDGCIGNTAIGRDELELAEPTGTPQDRTTLPATFTVENRYWPSWVRLRYPTKP